MQRISLTSRSRLLQARRGTLSLSKNSVFVIVQLDWTIQELLKRLDSPIKSENGKQREVSYTVTEKGRGLYIIESLDLRREGLSSIDITIKKDGVGDIAVFDFAEKNQPGKKR